MAQKGSIRGQKEPKRVEKSPQNDPRGTTNGPKSPQNGPIFLPKMDPKWSWGTWDFSKSTSHKCMPDLELQSELCRGVDFFLNVWVKIRLSRPTCCWPGHPWPIILGPLFWLEKVPILHSIGLEKAQKRAKKRDFGHLMHSIASFSPGLRYIIQLSGHLHHYDGFTISRKKTLFSKITFFLACFSQHPGSPRGYI